VIRRVRPVWPCARNVRAFCTTRLGGVSEGPWASLNLGTGVGDAAAAVAENRKRLAMALPGEPGWLSQVHGRTVVRREDLGGGTPEADAVVCETPDLPCAVLTADCLPVLFSDPRGTRVAAAHAGWRGLVAGVLEATVDALETDPGELLAWMGPGISGRHYEVGEDLREAVLDGCPDTGAAFSVRDGRLHADLYAVARRLLERAGVERIYGGTYCTFEDRERFYSHRRDGVTGRMATVIWLQPIVSSEADEEAP
jgi:YfiH family protein